MRPELARWFTDARESDALSLAVHGKAVHMAPMSTLIQFCVLQIERAQAERARILKSIFGDRA